MSPAPSPLARPIGRRGATGAAKGKILEVIRTNGGRATQSQLARALRLKDGPIRHHCEELAAAGALVRAGKLARPGGGRPCVVWALPAPPAVYRLGSSVALAARRGQGAPRVLEAIARLGGRASQSQLAGELGISSQTVAHHCRALAAEGRLEKGGLDKSLSNRGSQVWRLASGERFHSPGALQLRIAASSSSTRPKGTA